MIAINLKEEEFQNDVYALVRAFCPGEDVQVYVREQCPGIAVKLPDGDELTVEDTWSGHKLGRKERKSEMKRILYAALCEKMGKTLPWGTLTGIRPVKIPMQLLEAGIGDDEIAVHMKEAYRISDEKIRLSLEIARTEREVMRDIDYQDGWSLYVGIPFCPSICLYCSFSSYPYEKYGHLADAYLEALFQDLDYMSGMFAGRKLNTIYIGGGTPTTLNASQLRRLIGRIRDKLDVSGLKEFTVEAGRPDSITREKLEAMKEGGVTRISVNPQSMQQKTLDLIGRKHTVEQTREAFALAREVGFDNINMDLIVGLPGETAEDVGKTMEELRLLGPDSVTVHSLAVKRAARLNMEQDKYASAGQQEVERMIEAASEGARAMGLKPYYLYRQKNIAGNFENVGYAKVDKAGIYNILIMEERQTIAGIGAGASTKLLIPGENRIERVENVKNVEQYISRIDEMIDRKRLFFERNPIDGRKEADTAVYEDLEREIAHGICVSNLAVRLGRELGLSDEEQHDLAVAGFLHDIGKLKLSSYLYGHKKPLMNVERMKYVRTHARNGYQVLKEEGYKPSICEAVLYHHENYDGSGYPDNLSGEEIPYMARILRVCDVFAALTSQRSYREAFDMDTAAELMIEEVKNFDMSIFLAFQRIIHEEGIEQILNTKIEIQEDTL